MASQQLDAAVQRLREETTRADDLIREGKAFLAAFQVAEGMANMALLGAAPTKPKREPQQVKREAVRRALAELFPDGVPDQAELPNKMLCGAVASVVPFPTSVDTILRAARRK